MTTVSAQRSDQRKADVFTAATLKAESVLPELKDRVVGAYLGLAVGDALGATTEFLTPSEIRHQYGVHKTITGGGWLKLNPGQVTDDTQMSLALGESILQNKGVKADAVAEAFSNWMRSKPVDIGHTVRRGLIHYRNTGESSVAENPHDAGNGACMRCLPVAIFYYNGSLSELLQASRSQSHVTHHNPVADAGTECVLRMLVSAFHGNNRSDMENIAAQLLEVYPEYRYQLRRMENPGGWIVETLKAVFQSFFEHDNFEEALIDVVNRGGDSDTSGAILGMLAGAHYGKHSIPDKWLKALNPQVKATCEQQALDLLSQSLA